ncbi:MAG: AraC family transcriptional regulator [Bacteroidales bacterium]|nr:AraC family transcriptional regulator [Bacteroidales bacterium]
MGVRLSETGYYTVLFGHPAHVLARHLEERVFLIDAAQLLHFGSRQLRDRSLSFTEISDLFNFSSPAYFSRYVQRYLGETPSEYRG